MHPRTALAALLVLTLAPLLSVGAATAPDAPRNLTARALDSDTILLGWDDSESFGSSPARIDAYYIFFQGDTPGVDAHVDSTSSTFRYIDGLDAGTQYCFEIYARNEEGLWSPASNAACSLTYTTNPGVPGAPQALDVESSNLALRGTFTAPSTDGGAPVLGYHVYVNDELTHELSDSTTFFSYYGATNGIEHVVAVSAYNEVGEGPRAQVTTTPNPSLKDPGEPSVYGTIWPKNGDLGSIEIQWTGTLYEGSSPRSEFIIFEGGGDWYDPDSWTGEGIWTTVNPAATSAVVTGAQADQNYCFKIIAKNQDGWFRSSAASCQTTTSDGYGPGTVPSAPTSVSFTTSVERMDLSWAAPTDPGTEAVYRYHIYLDGTLEAAVGAGTTSHTIEGLADATTYNVEIKAVNYWGEGAAYTTGITVGPQPGAPSMPASFSLEAIGSRTIYASWAPSSGTVTEYKILDAETNSPYITIGSQNEYAVIEHRIPGFEYCYRISAWNGGIESSRSPTQCVTMPATSPPSAVQNLLALAGDTAARIQWASPASDGGGGIRAFNLYIDGNFNLSVPASQQDVLVEGLSNGQTYEFSVSAVNDYGEGPLATATATPFEGGTFQSSSGGGIRIDVEPWIPWTAAALGAAALVTLAGAFLIRPLGAVAVVFTALSAVLWFGRFAISGF